MCALFSRLDTARDLGARGQGLGSSTGGHQVFQSFVTASSAPTHPAASQLQALLSASASFLPQKTPSCWSPASRRSSGDSQRMPLAGRQAAGRAASHSPAPAWLRVCSQRQAWAAPHGYWPFRLASEIRNGSTDVATTFFRCSRGQS